MKKRLLILTIVLVILPLMASGQPATDDLVSSCVLAAGENTTYLKDFRVQLPKASQDAAFPVYKANMYLMKNMKYRFCVCDSPESGGELFITIYDRGKEIISSYNSSSAGNTARSILYATRPDYTPSGTASSEENRAPAWEWFV